MSTKIVKTRAEVTGGEAAQSVTNEHMKIQKKHKAMTYPIELHVLYSIMLPIYSTEVIGIVWWLFIMILNEQRILKKGPFSSGQYKWYFFSSLRRTQNHREIEKKQSVSKHIHTTKRLVQLRPALTLIIVTVGNVLKIWSTSFLNCLFIANNDPNDSFYFNTLQQ